MKKQGFIKNKVMVRLMVANVGKTSQIPHTNVIPPTFEGDDGDHVWRVQSQHHPSVTLQYPCPFHLLHKLHLQMGIVRQLLQASSFYSIDLYQPYN